MSEKIQLGRHEVEVIPQRHAYITNKVGKQLMALVEKGGDLSDPKSIFDFALREGAYGLLSSMCPTYGRVCPEFEFMGFASTATMEAGDYNEEDDFSPSPDQIIGAFEVIARVNRFDVLKILKGVVDPNLLKAELNARLAETLAERTEMSSGASASEPAPEAGSAESTSSGTTPPTSTGSEGSPSPASKTSDGPPSGGA